MILVFSGILILIEQAEGIFNGYNNHMHRLALAYTSFYVMRLVPEA